MLHSPGRRSTIKIINTKSSLKKSPGKGAGECVDAGGWGRATF